MLAVMVLRQHRVTSSKTVRTRAPCVASCMKHAIKTWSAVCSAAPHSQFGEGARLHLCMDEWNCPTPVCRQLNLTQAVRGKLIPIGQANRPTGYGYENTKHGCIFTVLRVPSINHPLKIADTRQGCLIDFAQLAQTVV